MKITESNEYREKQDHLQNLKVQFLDLYREYVDLGKENVVIYHQYNYLFGKVYHRRYELYCLCERSRRKIEMYQAALNRQEMINEEAAEQKLDEEFIEYIQKLNIIAEEYQNAVRFHELPNLQIADIQEIRRIYQKIAKKVHPDVHPESSEAAKDLWQKTLRSYKENDLEELQECELLLENLPEIPKEENRMPDDDITHCEKEIDDLHHKINYLISSFPYNQKELVQNKTAAEERLYEVEKDIIFFSENLKKLEARLAELNPVYEKNLC
jgi:hypothetical protein